MQSMKDFTTLGHLIKKLLDALQYIDRCFQSIDQGASLGKVTSIDL